MTEYFFYNDNSYEITKIEENMDFSYLPIVFEDQFNFQIEQPEFINTNFFADDLNNNNIEDDGERTDTASEGEEEEEIAKIKNLVTYNDNNSSARIIIEVLDENISLPEYNNKIIYPINIQTTTNNSTLDFSCPYCFRTFYKECYVKQHINSVHIYKPYSCNKCNKRFINNEILLEHIEKHNKKTPKAFKCNLCTKSYTYKADLKIHKLNIHNKNDRLHACNECSKKFSRKDHLLNHIRTHQTHHNKPSKFSNKKFFE